MTKEKRMPEPRKGESRKDFVSRCIPYVMNEDSNLTSEQAAGKCYGIYDNTKKSVEKSDPVKSRADYNGVAVDLEWLDGETREYPGSPYKNVLDGFDYGYVRDTSSPDGEEVDVYLRKDPDPEAPVFMVNQLHGGGENAGMFDEHKFFLGFAGEQEVQETYESFMEPSMFGGVIAMAFEDFKTRFLPFMQKSAGEVVKDDRPPKEWWDKTVSSLRGNPDVDDPEALASWMWSHREEKSVRRKVCKTITSLISLVEKIHEREMIKKYEPELMEVAKARTVQGYESPEPGDLPEAGSKLLAHVYAKCRADGGDKEKCAKIAWSAVDNAGYKSEKAEITKSIGEINDTVKSIASNFKK